MSYIDDEELKMNIDEEEDVEDIEEGLEDPIIDDDLLEDDNPLGDEFKGLNEMI